VENIRALNIFIQHRYIISFILILFLTISGCGSGGGGGSISSGSVNQGNNRNGFGPDSDVTGSVTLSWAAPVSNEDGSHLSDLAGYKIYYHPYSNTGEDLIDIGNYTGATISHLLPGIWCFALTAYDSAGNESSRSDEVCKEVLTI